MDSTDCPRRSPCRGRRCDPVSRPYVRLRPGSKHCRSTSRMYTRRRIADRGDPPVQACLEGMIARLRIRLIQREEGGAHSLQGCAQRRVFNRIVSDYLAGHCICDGMSQACDLSLVHGNTTKQFHAMRGGVSDLQCCLARQLVLHARIELLRVWRRASRSITVAATELPG